MSDPLKTSDIEDVLSSIRRLVSEESRPRAQTLAPAGPGKLVLTPALRVSEPDIDQDEDRDLVGMIAQDAEQNAEQQDEAVVSTADADGDDVVAEDDGAWQVPESLMLSEETALHDVEPDAPADEDAAVVPDAGEEAGVFVLSDAWQDQREAEGDDVAGAEADDVLEWEDHVEPDTAATAEPEAATEADARPEMDEQPTALLPEEPGPAPDAPGPIPEEQSAVPRQEAAEMPLHAAMPGEDDADMPPFDLLAEDTLLDEDMLREMVAEIVREELQGALGERITRNVRKLVRREIHRALSSQEFE